MNLDEISITPIKSSFADIAFYNTEVSFENPDLFQGLPEDYLSLIERFGEGIFADYIRIYPPIRAIKLTKYWKKLKEQNTCGVNYLAKKHMNESSKFVDASILLGDTLDGDQIIYYEGHYYVYHFQFSNYLKKVGTNLLSVFEYFEKGEKWEAIEIKTFTPFDSKLVNGSIGYITNTEIP